MRSTWPFLAAFVALPLGPGSAQAPAAGDQELSDARFMPWIGCWGARSEAVRPVEGRASTEDMICVRSRVEGPGVHVISSSRGEEVSREILVADGVREPVREGGCEGWESARFSEDGHRLYLRSELECEGGTRRETSGVSMILPGETWLEVRHVRSGEQEARMVRRYGPLPEGALEERGIEPPAADLSLAVVTARSAASRRLSIRDVTEALGAVGPEVVEAMLVERGEGFFLDSERLVELAERGVPGEITDLMVALSYPDVFQVEDGPRKRVAPRTAGPRRTGARGPYYDPFWGYDWWYFGGPFRYSRFGYYSPYSHWYAPSAPVIVVGPGTGVRAGGRVIKGRGYTRDGAVPGGRSAAVGTRGSPGRSGSVVPSRGTSRGSATRGGYSGGRRSGSTGRTAKPRRPPL